jgi:hypothetical protein
MWVLWHRYSDGSGAHIERVYREEGRAREDLALMERATEVGGSSGWKLDEVPMTGSSASPLHFPPGAR